MDGEASGTGATTLEMNQVAGPWPYRQDISGCLAETNLQCGLSQEALSRNLGSLHSGLADLRQAYESESFTLLRIVEDTTDLVEANQALTELSKDAETIVFFGTGGSSLGGQTLAQFGGWNIPGVKLPGQRSRPRVRFYDNLDPITLNDALKSLPLERCRFVITSKSGGTAETMVQAMVTIQALVDEGLQEKLPTLVLGITEPAKDGKNNALRTFLGGYNIPMLNHHTGIGGRFSALSNVGLLPAMAVGLDAQKIRQGASEVVTALIKGATPEDFPPALGAALMIGLNTDHGQKASVMMPYADRWAKFANWYVQLWAESLGKNGNGTIPVPAQGPVDQHSMLQLLMDGPREYVVNLITTSCQGEGPLINADMANKLGFDYLAGRPVGDLVAAQQNAVAKALIEAGRPVRSFHVGKAEERTMGAMMMHFMLETILGAHLLGIDPFDQPAVEVGKRLARQSLSG